MSAKRREMNYYSENDPYAADWIRSLQRTGHLPAGQVDTRSIVDVKASDVKRARQVHLFAGIGGWPLALKLAGWPEDQEVWTGSCPCQPYSTAGNRLGDKDSRNLWPHFRSLIAKRRPPVLFGEQVASEDGRHWLSGVRTDLEELGYAFGASDLCAAGVSAPHRRQRFFWVADTYGKRFSRGSEQDIRKIESTFKTPRWVDARRRRVGLEYPSSKRTVISGASEQKGNWTDDGVSISAGPWDRFSIVRCPTDGRLRRLEPRIEPVVDGFPGRVALIRGYGNAIVPEVAAEFIQAYLEATLAQKR